ncbi:ribonuclease H-like domain-containing protein [Tanacetum coccineum]
MFLSQRKYATEILERAHMAGCHPSRTSVNTESKLGDDGDPVSYPTLYKSLAGSLQYFTFTCLDISYIQCNSAVYLSSNPVQRTKHIEIDIHFVCDLVADGQVLVLHVLSYYQFADIFTKGLPSALFEEFRSSWSVQCPPAQTAEEC